MSAKKLDGLLVANSMAKTLKQRADSLRDRGIVPGLATLLVGRDPASVSYVSGKHFDCQKVGIESIRVELPDTISQFELSQAIAELNADSRVSGFIVQLPLPKRLNEAQTLMEVAPEKDADGLHPLNLGRLLQGDRRGPLPCTPAGILRLLDFYELPVAGKTVVVVGRGLTVGRPLGVLLSSRGLDATVILTHSRTSRLMELTRQADIVVACAGRPGLIGIGGINSGATVVDVGVTRVGKTAGNRAILAGDVDPRAAEVAGWLSPVPGGVGPMTRVMLLENVLSLAERAGVN